jgi:Protein of unknown function (DUF1329)
MRFIQSVIATAVVAVCGAHAYGKASDEDVNKLGTTLTAFGADPSASKDGLVPAYTGQLPPAPAGFKEETGRYPDPYANEKPLFSITQSNMGQYSDKLTEGAKALLKRYSDYRIDVYPSHRSMVYPKEVLAKTKEVAKTATLTDDDLSVVDAWGGIPFPIPKTGAEVIWNHNLTYGQPGRVQLQSGYLIDTTGAVTAVGDLRTSYYYPYYDADAKPGTWYKQLIAEFAGPPSSVGQKVLQESPLDYKKYDNTFYFYTPGLRRVRLAPELTYDTPSSAYGGAILGDEPYMFDGKMDRFDWKLVGKKEMIIPYNSYKLEFETPTDKMFTKHFLNPDAVRWEVHRVWVVEATLKPGARHVMAKRTFYVDEDTWAAAAQDGFDHAGNIYRAGFDYPWVQYGSNPGSTNSTFSYNDFSKGNYVLSNVIGPNGYFRIVSPDRFKTKLTPDAMAGSGVR